MFNIRKFAISFRLKNTKNRLPPFQQKPALQQGADYQNSFLQHTYIVYTAQEKKNS